MRKISILFIFFASYMTATFASMESVNNYKAHAYSEIEDLQENYYFIYIYRGSCPHCQTFTPILQDFATTFKVAIDAYSADSEYLADFKPQPLTAELFKDLYTIGSYQPVVPALFLLNRHTFQAYPLFFGEATAAQLATRVHQILSEIKEKFND